MGLVKYEIVGNSKKKIKVGHYLLLTTGEIRLITNVRGEFQAIDVANGIDIVSFDTLEGLQDYYEKGFKFKICNIEKMIFAEE